MKHDDAKMTGRDIGTVNAALKDCFSRHPEVEAGYVFGSVAQGNTNPLSDIDVAILVNADKIDQARYPYGYKAAVLTELMKSLKMDDVDLVVLNDAPLLLKHRVVSLGKLVFSRDEKRRVGFQVDVINRYSDMMFLRGNAH